MQEQVLILFCVVVALSLIQWTSARRKSALIVSVFTGIYIAFFYGKEVTGFNYFVAILFDVAAIYVLRSIKITPLSLRLGLMCVFAAIANLYGLTIYHLYMPPDSYQSLMSGIYLATIVALLWRDKTDVVDLGNNFTTPFIRSWGGWRSERLRSFAREAQ